MITISVKSSRLVITIITTLITMAGLVLVDSQSVLAEDPTASNNGNCFIVTIANLPAQTSLMQACLELGLPTSLSVPGVGDIVASIMLPNQDSQSCPLGTTPISSEDSEIPLLFCMYLW
jgi:hypothetical protein